MTKPLSGRTVVLTRPRAQSERLAAALRRLGARVIFAPLIKTVPPRSFRALDESLQGLADFDAVVFASANAVHAFFARAKKLLRKRPSSAVLAAAVGPATAKVLSGYGWKAAIVPEDCRAEGLAQALRLVKGCRVLIPRAEQGRETLVQLLRARGAKVTLATAYRTQSDPQGRRELRRALARGAHAVLFASPSAVRSAAGALGRARMRRAFKETAAVAIGPTTAAALRVCGVAPAAVSKRPDAEAFAETAARALAKR